MSSRQVTAQALNESAVKALSAGNVATAIELLRQALTMEPRSTVLLLNLAAGLRESGDMGAAVAAVDRALAVEPRLFRGLLMKGALLDASGQFDEAALVYGRALAVAPPAERLDAHTRRAVDRAWEVNQQFVRQTREKVVAELASAAPQASLRERERVLQFLDATLGIKRVFRQEPTHFTFPELPAIAIYPREEFPWLAELEAGTATIQSELRQVLAGDDGFRPYVEYSAGKPLDQWKELNNSRRWSAFHFYHEGVRNDANCARCPETVALLERLGQPRVANHMPAAMFSVLAPHTRIPAHTGVANVRLVVHLALIVPPGCGFRVGNETRPWRVGEAFVFDDTIEHEAWNDSDEARVVLIFDIWNPRISPHERELIASVMESMGRNMPKQLASQP